MPEVYEKDLPAWYYLSFQDKPELAIILGLNKNWLAANQNDLVKLEECVIRICRMDKLTNFYSLAKASETGFFGFNKSFILKKDSASDDFIEFLIPLPSVFSGKKKCSWCEGTGDWTGVECPNCKGSGKIPNRNGKDHDIAHSFRVILKMLSFNDKKFSSDLIQLMTIETTSKTGDQGHAIDGDTSPKFRNFLRLIKKENGNKGIANLAKIIAGVHFQMESSREVCTAVFGERVICLTNQQNACTLDINLNTGGMSAFYPHNINHSVQQLAFLAALAKLWDMARNNGT